MLRCNLTMLCSPTYHCFNLFTCVVLAEMLHQAKFAKKKHTGLFYADGATYTLVTLQLNFRFEFQQGKLQKSLNNIPRKPLSLIRGQVDVPLFPFNFGHDPVVPGTPKRPSLLCLSFYLKIVRLRPLPKYETEFLSLRSGNVSPLNVNAEITFGTNLVVHMGCTERLCHL